MVFRIALRMTLREASMFCEPPPVRPVGQRRGYEDRHRNVGESLEREIAKILLSSRGTSEDRLERELVFLTTQNDPLRGRAMSHNSRQACRFHRRANRWRARLTIGFGAWSLLRCWRWRSFWCGSASPDHGIFVKHGPLWDASMARHG